MFQQRQFNEVQNLEISFALAVSPGAVANNTTVSASAACTLSGGTAATFTLSDQLEVFSPTVAANNGLSVTATPTATVGTARIYFQNATGGSITPVSGTYTIIAYRVPLNIVS